MWCAVYLVVSKSCEGVFFMEDGWRVPWLFRPSRIVWVWWSSLGFLPLLHLVTLDSAGQIVGLGVCLFTQGIKATYVIVSIDLWFWGIIRRGDGWRIPWLLKAIRSCCLSSGIFLSILVDSGRPYFRLILGTLSHPCDLRSVGGSSTPSTPGLTRVSLTWARHSWTNLAPLP